jgi:type II secretory pathway component PulF
MALELQARSTLPETKTDSAKPRRFSLPTLARPALGNRDRMFFTEQLALLLETGANLYSALQTLKKQSQIPAMTELLDALMTDISEGRPFSQALAKHPKLFSSSYVNLIAASEAGGFMHSVLYELQSMEEKRAELKSTLYSALSYPVFLMLFSVAVVIFVLLMVFPKFGDLFTSIYDQLPVTTKFLMNLSDIMLDNWVYILVSTGALVAGLAHWISSAGGRETIDRLILQLPILKQFFGELYMIQSLRVISLSLGNGVSMMETLNACRDIIDNSTFRRFIGQIEKLVEEGGGIARAFEDAPFVPAVAKAMISTGEESGNLAPVAARIADYYEQQLTRRLKAIARMAEPIMLLVMGAVVGLLVSSLILPIFKLSRAVS